MLCYLVDFKKKIKALVTIWLVRLALLSGVKLVRPLLVGT